MSIGQKCDRGERHESEDTMKRDGKKGRARVGRRAIANPAAGGRGRMPRSTLSIGVAVSSSVSSGRLSLSPTPTL